jgi:predicted DNA-binding protein
MVYYIIVMKKPGPKPIKPEERQSVILPFRVRPREAQKLDALARKAGVTRSAIFRQMLDARLNEEGEGLKQAD